MIVTPRSRTAATLPLPPSTNNLFATVRGKRVKSREYRAWLSAVAPLLVELRPPKALPAAVRVGVFGKVNAARDLDNMLKPIGDALVAGGVLPGDSLKYVTEWRVCYGGEWGAPPAVVVEVVPA